MSLSQIRYYYNPYLVSNWQLVSMFLSILERWFSNEHLRIGDISYQCLNSCLVGEEANRNFPQSSGNGVERVESQEGEGCVLNQASCVQSGKCLPQASRRNQPPLLAALSTALFHIIFKCVNYFAA